MSLALGRDFSAVLTERGGLLVFGGTRHTANSVYPRPLRRPRLLGGDGDAEGDDVRMLVGGIEALALAGGARAPAQGNVQEHGTHAAEGLGVPGAAPPGHPFAGEALVMVAAGKSHFCALTETGTVWVWGRNDFGQLGTNDDTDVRTPVRWTAAPGGNRYAMVACADEHTVCLLQDGSVYACGEGGSAQNGNANGNEQHRIRRVRGLQSIGMVAAGRGYSAALERNGAVWIWGNGNDEWDSEDENGEPRPGAHVPRRTAPDSFGGSLAQLVSVGCGFWGAVTAQGELWMCGDGEHGCLGCGDRAYRTEPVLVGGAAPSAWNGSQVLMVSCGRWHVAAVTVAGTVWTWGDGRQFKLGHGDEEDRLSPAQIAPAAFAGAHMVLAAAEDNMSMAVTREGLLYVWGTGHLGREVLDGDELAGRNGDQSVARVPVPVEESLCPGSRVGRSCGLRRRDITAFCMGTHAGLGGGGGGCVYQDVPTEILTTIEQQSRILAAPYERMSEGLLRLLAVRERVD